MASYHCTSLSHTLRYSPCYIATFLEPSDLQGENTLHLIPLATKLRHMYILDTQYEVKTNSQVSKTGTEFAKHSISSLTQLTYQ